MTLLLWRKLILVLLWVLLALMYPSRYQSFHLSIFSSIYLYIYYLSIFISTIYLSFSEKILYWCCYGYYWFWNIRTGIFLFIYRSIYLSFSDKKLILVLLWVLLALMYPSRYQSFNLSLYLSFSQKIWYWCGYGYWCIRTDINLFIYRSIYSNYQSIYPTI